MSFKHKDSKDMSEDCIIISQYYGLARKLKECLDAEAIKLGTSLLSDKIGKKVFSEDFTVLHNTCDKDRWMTTFWDGRRWYSK